MCMTYTSCTGHIYIYRVSAFNKSYNEKCLALFCLGIIILHNGQLLDTTHIPNDKEINHQKLVLKEVKVRVCLG